jgi:hypothetical protein
MTTAIPAILILNKNKTYGRTPNGRLLYKAVLPNSAQPLLVPYNLKPSFSKAYANLYVLIKDATTAEIVETIGPVDDPANTYTYELHCKGLWLSHPTAYKRPRTLPTFFLETPSPAHTAPPTVFTIDGPTTKDFDDAFSIRPGELTIYISNVPLILAHMGLLTDLVAGEKMSSIYLPDRVIPMMPTRFSEGLCSLRACPEPKPCFTLTFHIASDGTIIDHQFGIQTVVVGHNYVYDSDELLASEHYKSLVKVTRAVFERAAFTVGEPSIARTFNFTTCPQTSADVVAYWMLMMNWAAAMAMSMAANHTADIIYRASRAIERDGAQDPAPHLLPPETEKAIARRYGDYMVGEYTTIPTPHDTLGVPAYTHVTSPIRRMPDVINITAMMLSNPTIIGNIGSTIHEHLRRALDIYYTAQDDYCARLNAQMRNIKAVQRDCDLLAIAATVKNMQYDVVLCAPCDVGTEWEIYIPELHLFTRAPIPFGWVPHMYDKVLCELFVLHDALTTRRLVRVNLLSPPAHPPVV